MVTTETLFCVRMFSVETFKDWLLAELKVRGWSQNDLAKRANLSHGTVSNIINGNKGLGADSLNAIAHAFHLPPESVFRAAGLLPPAPPDTEYSRELTHLAQLLTPEDKDQLIAYARWLLERRKPKR